MITGNFHYSKLLNSFWKASSTAVFGSISWPLWVSHTRTFALLPAFWNARNSSYQSKHFHFPPCSLKSFTHHSTATGTSLTSILRSKTALICLRHEQSIDIIEKEPHSIITKSITQEKQRSSNCWSSFSSSSEVWKTPHTQVLWDTAHCNHLSQLKVARTDHRSDLKIAVLYFLYLSKSVLTHKNRMFYGHISHPFLNFVDQCIAKQNYFTFTLRESYQQHVKRGRIHWWERHSVKWF